MSTTTSNEALSSQVARVGGVLVGVGVALSLILQTPLIPPSVRENSSFLLFVAQGMAAVSGFMVLTSNLRQAIWPVRYGTTACAGSVMAGLLGCFFLAVFGWSDTARLIGQEFGVVTTEVLFFLFAGGIDDILSAVKKWQHGLAVFAWLGNIVAMTTVVLVWTYGHLWEGDNILTAAFLVAYATLPSTKYVSLAVTSTHGSRKAQAILGAFVVIPLVLGWLYLIALTRPDLLPSDFLNSCLFSTAIAFGVSYGVDGILRGKPAIPWLEFLVAIGLQTLCMVGSGIIGAFLPSSAPLVIGLLCMETLPNAPGAFAIISELFQKKPQNAARWFRPEGPLRWYSSAFGIALLASIVLCSLAIYFQDYAIVAGGMTICLLQATPWVQVAQRACLEWAKRPDRALFTLITALVGVSAVCVFLAIWIAGEGRYTQSDLVAIWYSIARIPSAVCLGCFGLLGVILVGDRAPKAWRYLLIVCTAAVLLGFAWFVPALFAGGVAAVIAPALLMQIAGGINVTLVYAAFNSSTFRVMANAALATKPGNAEATTNAATEGEEKGEN